MSLRALLGSLVLLSSLPLTAATFTVTSGADSGPGTLRQAILDANAAPGRDQIVLQADVTIDSSLPDITGPIDITGAGAPDGRHDINVSSGGPSTVRLQFSAGSDGSTVDSISFGPIGQAIHIAASDVTVTNVRVPSAGVRVAGNDNTIGGPSASDRNEILALDITGDRNIVLGNTIEQLLVFFADDVQIGTAAAGNTIASTSIQDSSSTSVRNNTFTGRVGVTEDFAPVNLGPTITGNTFTLAGSGEALTLSDQTSGFISNNVIRAPTGIIVEAGTTGVEISANDIVTTSGLPIDLGQDGPTPNDPAPDADTGGNSRQNFPVLNSAIILPGQLEVEGTLTSAPLTPYHIEIFGDDTTLPNARTFLGSFMVTTDAAGNATFSETVASPLVGPSAVITATATNKGAVAIPGSTPSSTSELSAPFMAETPGRVRFPPAIPGRSVVEDGGSITVTVQRIGGSAGTITVDFATSDGSATAPGDYTATSGTLTFGPGVTEQTFTVPITNDMSPEINESFSVTLSNPTGGATIGISEGTAFITIFDDDEITAEVPTLSEWAMIALAMGLAAVALMRRL